MSTLITGGAGLLGSCFDFGLKPNRNELNLLNYEMLLNYLKQNDINKIIHCAAKVGGVKGNSTYPYEYFVENMEMNMNVIKACKELNIQNVLFLLSTCVFPQNAPLPLDEKMLHTGEPHPSNFAYAYSKRMLEVGSRCLKIEYNINSNCLVPCNLYGKNDNYDIENGHVIPSLIHKCYKAKLNNEDFVIWGSGNAEREFMYANDLADIISHIYKNSIVLNLPMIISPDNIYTIKEIVEHIVKLMKFDGKVVFDSSKPEGILKKNTLNDTFKQYFPSYKFTNLEDGLSETIEYFIKNYEYIRK